MSIITKPGIEETGTSFRYRVRDPDDFDQESFTTIPFKKSSPKISAVVGHLKGETTTTLQSLIFPKDEGWDKEKVSAWVADHKADLKGLDAGRFESEAEWVTAPDVADAELADLMAFQAKTPMPGRMIRKTFGGAALKTIYPDEYRADVVISSADIDRDREVVDPAGLTWAKGQAMPLVGGHMLGNLMNQIGTLPKVKRDGEQIVGTPEWLVGLGNPQADWGWTLAKKGVAKFSIGFIPIEWKDADLTDEKVVARIQAGKEPIRTHTKAELVEVSQVIVPSNRSAVQRMIDAGILVAEAAQKALDVAKDTPFGDQAQALFDGAIEAWKGIKKAAPPEPAPTPAPDEDDDILKGLLEAKSPQAVVDVKVNLLKNAVDENILDLDAITPRDVATKPRDEHGCEPGHHWNMDTQQCEKDKAKGAITEYLAERERASEAWMKASDYWWAAYDLILELAKEPADQRAEKIDAILAELVALAKPAFLDVVNLEAERLAEARTYVDAQRKGPKEWQRMVAEVTATLATMQGVLDVLNAESVTRGTLDGELQARDKALFDKIQQEVQAAVAVGLKGVVTDVILDERTQHLITDLTDAATLIARREVAKAKGRVDQYLLETK